ncbi:MAG: hypothetical protein WC560_09270 [Syntrophales bacterium]
MLITKFPEETQKFEVQVYKKPESIKNLRESHVPFSGSPRKHPYNPDRVILITDPYSTITSYYEFKTEDISYVEALANLVNIEGEIVNMARIWVKKKSVATRASLFVVEDTTA